MITVTIQATPTQAINFFRRLEMGLSSFKKPFERCIIWMHKSWADSFKKKGRENAWKENSEATVLIKRGNNPLQNNGYLRASLTGNTTYTYTEIGSDKLELGTTAPYAKLQDEGISIPVTEKMRMFMIAKYGIILSPSKQFIEIPPRKFMFFTNEDLKVIADIWEKWIIEEMIISAA